MWIKRIIGSSYKKKYTLDFRVLGYLKYVIHPLIRGNAWINYNGGILVCNK